MTYYQDVNLHLDTVNFFSCRVKRVSEDGMMRKWMKMFWPTPAQCHEDRKITLSMGDVQGIFFCLFTMLLTSVGTLVVEVVCKMFRFKSYSVSRSHLMGN